jgi:hypothetical protein|tara:strand:+ start:122 stop:388 length:267 start_codon:yes stop_codon:yes gene_type:complete
MKTPSDLKHLMEQDPDSKYFSRENMKFFGDTMANFGLRQPKDIEDINGDTRFAYELYRKRPVKAGLNSSSWFEIKDGIVTRVFLATPR